MVVSSTGSSSPIVLVVEDEHWMRYQIADFLRHGGCTVLEACSADQAVALGRQVPLDVLLTDADLNSSESGLDVAKALRADQPSIGVIYVSAIPVDHERRVSDSLCFCKPYSGGVILHACRELASAATRDRIYSKRGGVS